MAPNPAMGDLAGGNSPESKAFQNSFDKIASDQQNAAAAAAASSTQTATPQVHEIEQKMMSTFKRFCRLVESGTKEALTVKSKVTNGSVNSSTSSLLLAPQTSAGASGNSPASSPMMGRSRVRPDSSPSLINHRNMRRTSSGRVRAVGRTASCYMAREGSHKLRVTVEARLRADAHDPNPEMSTVNIASAANAAMGTTSSESLAAPIISIEDQAREVRDAISTMIKGLPPLIPGTPIIVVFNAIIEHEHDDERSADIQRAFSWRTQMNTPDGKEKLEQRQAELEAAFKEQGISLDTTKVNKKESGLVSKLFGRE